MIADSAFRLILIAGLLIVLPLMVYHRLQSGVFREKLDRRQEGLFTLATLRPIALVLWLGVLAYMVNPAWMAWSSMPLPWWRDSRATGIRRLGQWPDWPSR